MRMTITSVDQQHRIWEGGANGPLAFVQGSFSDGSDWSVGCKPDNAEKRKEEMKALIGQEGEYELEAKADFQGKKQWKLKNYPGKAAPGGFGGGARSGGGTFNTAFKNTREGMALDHWHISRSVALKAATDICAAGFFKDKGDQAGLMGVVIECADDFAEWLSKPCPNVPQEAPQAAPPATNGKPAGDLAARTAKALEAFRKCQTGQALAEVWAKAGPLLKDAQGTQFESQIRAEHTRVDALLTNFAQGPPDYL
jgi:hypothetical protein